MAKQKGFKNRVGVVYSTSDDFQYTSNEEADQETLAPADQALKVHIESIKGGKKATIVRGFVGAKEDLSDLGKKLKSKCGVGGSSKEGEIIIQGDQREKVMCYLLDLGYRAKKSGG